ncbi:unnamed protein product [Calypogeia fissa]
MHVEVYALIPILIHGGTGDRNGLLLLMKALHPLTKSSNVLKPSFRGVQKESNGSKSRLSELHSFETSIN